MILPLSLSLSLLLYQLFAFFLLTLFICILTLFLHDLPLGAAIVDFPVKLGSIDWKPTQNHDLIEISKHISVFPFKLVNTLARLTTISLLDLISLCKVNPLERDVISALFLFAQNYPFTSI